jgi:hypothetical protein
LYPQEPSGLVPGGSAVKPRRDPGGDGAKRDHGFDRFSIFSSRVLDANVIGHVVIYIISRPFLMSYLEACSMFYLLVGVLVRLQAGRDAALRYIIKRDGA